MLERAAEAPVPPTASPQPHPNAKPADDRQAFTFEMDKMLSGDAHKLVGESRKQLVEDSRKLQEEAKQGTGASLL